MKLNKLFTLMVVFAMLLAFAPAASAQGPVGDWISGIACQNLDDANEADITLAFYLEGANSAALEYDDTIDAGGSVLYFTPSTPPGVPEGFLGSVMIQSSAPLACNVNTQTTGTGTADSPIRVGTSAGFGDAETSTTMYAPQVMKAYYGWASYIAVQNATATAIDVELSFKDATGADIPAATETANIPGYSNHVFYQEENTNLPASNFIGAATITGDDAIAVTVNFYNAGADAGTSQLHSYNGFAAGDTTLLIPRFVRRYYGYNSGMSIQNVGTAATTVAIAFNIGGTAYNYTTASIEPGAALPLYATTIAALDGVDAQVMNTRYGSAIMTASQPIIAMVNEDNRGNAIDNNGDPVPATRIGQGSTYNAFNDGTQTTDVFMAQVVDLSTWAGGFQVMNTTATAGTCDATFVAVSPAFELTDQVLPANGSWAIFAPSVTGLGDYNGSVMVVCTQPVVAISNLAAVFTTGLLGDSFTTANALNR